MRYAFIINPAAGQGNHDKGIVKDIEDLIAGSFDEDIGLYYTRCPGDATELSDTLALEAMKAGEDIVIFACGGDGTANEVANGIYGYDNAILGVVPIGSGNDLVRELAREKGNYKDYLNASAQMNGKSRPFDLLKVSWNENGEEKCTLCVNGINIGFDGNTAARARDLKQKPLLSGSLAYIAAVIITLIKKDGQSLRVTADGEDFFDGDLMLTTAGNGGYCGGGIRSCPYALLDDGEMELMTIKEMSRLSFIGKFMKFRAGRMFEIKGVENFAVYKRSKAATIEPLKNETMRYVIDGEVFVTGAIRVEVIPGALEIWEI